MAVPAPQNPAGLTPEQWSRLETIFHAALQHGLEQRMAWAAAACGSDAVLREQVEKLLAVADEAAGFLDSARRALGVSETTRTIPGAAEAGFAGTERFEVRRKLGAGGFGAVYEVFDREQNATLALKTLHGAGISRIERLKAEFRSLADISHPNLVCFHEMLLDGGTWFFTMELVDGCDFLHYLCPARGCCDFERVRVVFPQLIAGVQALHDHGKLHRDLKPSNVLVTAEGRLVIVDFGLASDAELHDRTNLPLEGTLRYMAPELISGRGPSPAADWYAVGIMLREAFHGGIGAGEEAAPGGASSKVPEDLEHLCETLLSQDPRDRPTGHDLLRIAGHPQAALTRLPEAPFVGRARELRALNEALLRARAGGNEAILITGASGAGKSALARHFLNEAAGYSGTPAFSGRCYAQELVPYNAFDELASALGRHLRNLPFSEAAGILGGSAAGATRLFPALRPLERTASELEPLDTPEARQAAFDGFRTVLQRLSAGGLLLFIDDLQWSDADSLQLLTAILRPPSIPGLFFLGCFRDEGEGPARIERELLANGRQAVSIRLGPLDEAAACSLAAHLQRETSPQEAAELARESGGSPYLLVELARYAASRAGTSAPASRTLEDVLQSRIAQLPAPAARLLEIVSVAGGRIGTRLAWEAAGQSAARESAVSVLRAQRLVRLHRTGDRYEIESYHDRVRETVEKSLDGQVQRDLHLRLARKLEEAGGAKAQRLAIHFRAGGDRAKALQHSLAAAEEAQQALAFESAAQWYRAALEADEDRTSAFRIRRRLAEALSSAGRGAEAAALFLECARSAGAGERMELERRAAADLLVSGRTQDGLDALAGVLRAAGMKMPPTALRAVPGLVWDRVRILLRGTAFRESGAPAPLEQLSRVDACWTVAQGLGVVDTVRAARFHARHLRLALDAGDPYRAARALALEAAFVSVVRGHAPLETGRILERVQELAQRCGNPHAFGLVHLADAMSSFLGGRWARSYAEFRQAEEIFRERCSGVAWELATARLAGCVALFFLGKVRELADRLPGLVENARARGDIYEATDLQIRIAHAVHLADDRPEIAAGEVRDAISQWPRGSFYVQHWWAMIAQSEIALYAEDTGEAWRVVTGSWGPLRRSLLLGAEYIRLESLFHRGAAAIALACQGGSARARLLQTALADARRIERANALWAAPLGDLIHAGVAAARNEHERCLRRLKAAAAGFDDAGMELYAAAARRRAGEVMGGVEGREMIRNADAWMKLNRIRDPVKMSRFLAPGRFSR